MNNLGNIIPYIGSYFYHLDNSVSISDFVILSPISYISDVIVTTSCGILLKTLTPYSIILFGLTIAYLGIFISSFITNPYLFCWVFGLSYGVIPAVIFLPCVWILWNNIQENKARTSGFLLACYSFGPVPYTFLFTMIANPYDYPAETVKTDGKEDEKAFGNFVSYRVPMTIRWVIMTYCICSAIGLMCLPRKWISENENQKIQTTMTLKDIIKKGKFWNLIFLLACCLSNLGYMQNIYKIIGMISIKDDHFISFISSGAFFLSVFGRILYGFLLDKYSWKRIMVITYIIEIIFSITFTATFSSRFWYAFYILTFAFLNTAMYNSVMIQTNRNFPNDKWVFNFVSIGMLWSFTLPYLLQKFITPYIGYFFTLLIVTLFTVISMFQVIFHPLGEEINDKLLE